MKRCSSGIAIVGLSSFLGMLFTTLDSIDAFTQPSTKHPQVVHSPTTFLVSTATTTTTTTTALSSSFSSSSGEGNQQDGEDGSSSTTDENEKAEFNWLEEWAMEGKDAVALMKTAERTQRAMLAQMTEDRIYEITKVLDTLVDQTTGQIAEEDMPRAKELAVQTRNLQKEYKDLVTGAPSTMLETLASLNVSSSDDEDDEKTTGGDNEKK